MRLRMTAYTVVTLLVLCPLAQVAEATSLPTGPWTIIANGSSGTFQVTSVDGSGNLNATAFGQQTTGFYSTTANRIFFLRQAGGFLDTVQQYAGDLFLIPATPGTCTYVLAGQFSAFAGTGGTNADNVFGWVAFKDAPC